MTGKRIIIACCCLIFATYSIAQDVNLDSLLDEEIDKKSKNETRLTEATFKTSRLINSQTVETTQKGVLDLKISHRFSETGNGFYDLWGLDNAINMRFGAEYGLTNRFTIGAGHNSYEKEYDGFLKYRLLWQSTGKQKIPFSLTLLSSFMFATDTALLNGKVPKDNSGIPSRSLNTSDKFSYALQALIARKFNNDLSLQLLPTVVHNNLVPINLYSIGIGGRLKLTKRSSIIGEYYFRFHGNELPEEYPKTYNSFSLGYEIETGGHVFQLTLSNSTGITERTFITETTNPWSFGSLHLGFNISRVFTIQKPKNLPTQEMQSNKKWSPSTDSAFNYKTNTASNFASDSVTRYTIATFKTTRLINGHTVETTQKGVLDFKVTHRFGKLNSGFYNLFGLDYAAMRFGFDYGITDRFNIGIGRFTTGKSVNPHLPAAQSLEKGYDAFLKYKLLRQSTGKQNMPVSLTLLSSVMLNTLKTPVKLNTPDRFSYAFQVLAAHKFGDALSLQIAPTLVHYNLVDSSFMPNNLYSIGGGARIKLTQRSSLNIEYYYQINKLEGTNNSLAIGYEIETAGHVFQLQLTNSYGLTEKSFITDTKGKWEKGDIHFGFNISRVFTVKKPKTAE